MSLELFSNLKRITSNSIPTTSTLAVGELAFGIISGVPKIYGNANGEIKEYGLSDCLPISGGTLTGALNIPNNYSRVGNKVYNIGHYQTIETPKETIIKTNIPWRSGAFMPVIDIHGYAYGLTSPIQLQIGFYIYNSQIGWTGSVCMGAWAPEIYLYKYIREGVESVAIGLKGSCYFLGFAIDIQDEMRSLYNINLTGWNVEFNTTSTSVIPAVDNVTCVQSQYKPVYNPAIPTTPSGVGLGNVANERQYSANNTPPYPVTSVNAKTGAVVISKADIDLNNVANERQYSATNPPPYPTAPVTSVNAKTGVVVVNKADVGLGNVDNVKQYSASNPPPYPTAPVTSVAGKTGVVTLTKADVGLSEVNNTSDVSKNVHGAYTFLGKDTRNVNSPPSYYLNGEIAICTHEFKFSSVIEVPTSIMDNTYCFLETFVPWYDVSGGYPIQVAMQNSTAGIPKMMMRCGVNANSWSAWTPMAPGGGSTPYKTTISSWSGSVGNYTSTISAATHGKGTDPQVETFIGTTRYYDDYDIATNGDITFRSSANISLNIKIR